MEKANIFQWKNGELIPVPVQETPEASHQETEQAQTGDGAVEVTQGPAFEAAQELRIQQAEPTTPEPEVLEVPSNALEELEEAVEDRSELKTAQEVPVTVTPQEATPVQQPSSPESTERRAPEAVLDALMRMRSIQDFMNELGVIETRGETVPLEDGQLWLARPIRLRIEEARKALNATGPGKKIGDAAQWLMQIPAGEFRSKLEDLLGVTGLVAAMEKLSKTPEGKKEAAIVG